MDHSVPDVRKTERISSQRIAAAALIEVAGIKNFRPEEMRVLQSPKEHLDTVTRHIMAAGGKKGRIATTTKTTMKRTFWHGHGIDAHPPSASAASIVSRNVEAPAVTLSRSPRRTCTPSRGAAA